MKTIKKAVVLLAVLPFFFATAFALDYFEVDKPSIKKAAIFISVQKSTTLNKQFVSQIQSMLEASLLFTNVAVAKNADYSIILENSIESKELLVTIKGEKQTEFQPKYFGLKFLNTEEEYVQRKTSQMGNRIIKELFGISGAIGSTLTWSQTENARKVIYKKAFAVPNSGMQVTYNFYTNYGASWNQANDQIIYTSHTDFGTVINLQQVEPLIFKAHEIFTQAGIASSPIWASDGSIYMTLYVSNQNSDIVKFELEGDAEKGYNLKKVRAITHMPTIETEPAISADGMQMAFVSDQTSEPQVYILDLATQKVTRVTRTGGYNVSPVWSPNGRYLAYRSIRQGISSLYRINIETKEEKRLTAEGILAEEPTWSPDGSLLAFTGRKDKQDSSKIYYMLASGGDYQRLTDTAQDVVESGPTWGPSLH
ncbi:hypothetical protein KJ966_28215 [bacterium]|nr:hypothetical protein [bacterium]